MTKLEFFKGWTTNWDSNHNQRTRVVAWELRQLDIYEGLYHNMLEIRLITRYNIGENKNYNRENFMNE